MVEIRIFAEDEELLKLLRDSDIEAFNRRGLKWFADERYAIIPSLEKDDTYSFKGHYVLKKWCEDNCTGNVGILDKMYEAPVFYFAEESDATMFRMTWGR